MSSLDILFTIDSIRPMSPVEPITDCVKGDHCDYCDCVKCVEDRVKPLRPSRSHIAPARIQPMSKDSKSVLSKMRKQAKKEGKFFKRQADYGTLWLPKITVNDKKPDTCDGCHTSIGVNRIYCKKCWAFRTPGHPI